MKPIDGLKEHAGCHQSVASPLASARLPSELLGIIFEMVLINCEDASKLITLCLVSWTWHNAALSTHNLWGTLHLASRHRNRVTPRRLQKAFQWLRRAGSVPKALKLDLDQYPTCQPHELAELIPVLLGLEIDLHHLSIHFPSGGFETFVDKIAAHKGHRSTHWNSVKFLEISVAEHSKPKDFREGDFDNLSHATSLALRLPYFGATPIGYVPHSMIQGLKSLELRIECRWQMDKIFEILHSCTNVEVLKLHFVDSEVIGVDLRSEGAPPQWPNISLINLRALHLPHFHSRSLILLDQLEMRGLEKLNLCFKPDISQGDRYNDEYLEEDHEYFALAFRDVVDLDLFESLASYPNLRRLRLHGADLDGEYFIDMDDVFGLLEQMTHITFDEVTYPDEFFASPSDSRSNSRMLPNLKELELVRVDVDHAEDIDVHLVDLLLQREQSLADVKPKSSLKRVAIIYAVYDKQGPGKELESSRWMDVRRQCGTQVEIGSKYIYRWWD
ncbi:hypothetical protein NMY22_g13385 [Coprinellus aureogranulatus]|nr:hypothetical protein NMY22_g13385 [Coprinellus aureogranulatus]